MLTCKRRQENQFTPVSLTEKWNWNLTFIWYLFIFSALSNFDSVCENSTKCQGLKKKDKYGFMTLFILHVSNQTTEILLIHFRPHQNQVQTKSDHISTPQIWTTNALRCCAQIYKTVPLFLLKSVSPVCIVSWLLFISAGIPELAHHCTLGFHFRSPGQAGGSGVRHSITSVSQQPRSPGMVRATRRAYTHKWQRRKCPHPDITPAPPPPAVFSITTNTSVRVTALRRVSPAANAG